MELRGAGVKGRLDPQTLLTSTMTRIRPGTGTGTGSNKSSFLQLQSIPPALRPLVRAYLLGYASAVLPRLLTLVLQHLSNRKRKTPKYALPERDENTFLESAKHVLKTGLDPCRFPTFCAALVGGSTLLQVGHGPHFLVDFQDISIHQTISHQISNHTSHHNFPTHLPQFPHVILGPVVRSVCFASPTRRPKPSLFQSLQITSPPVKFQSITWSTPIYCLAPVSVIFSANFFP
jgi:hypothetical protein